MNRSLFIFSSVIALMILVSCSGKPSLVLDDDTCIAPCWSNISPGETNKDDALNIVKQTEGIQQESIKEQQTFLPMNEDMVYWKFQGVKELNGDFSTHNDIVVMISFNFKEEIAIRDFFKKNGEPDYVYLFLSKGPGAYLTVKFIYQEEGICLSHQPSLFPFQDPREYRVRDTTLIGELFYIDPSIENGQTKIGCLRGLDANQYSKNLQKWSGYGVYDVSQ